MLVSLHNAGATLSFSYLAFFSLLENMNLNKILLKPAAAPPASLSVEKMSPDWAVSMELNVVSTVGPFYMIGIENDCHP